jgi:hypothetical protein
MVISWTKSVALFADAVTRDRMRGAVRGHRRPVASRFPDVAHFAVDNRIGTPR